MTKICCEPEFGSNKKRIETLQNRNLAEEKLRIGINLQGFTYRSWLSRSINSFVINLVACNKSLLLNASCSACAPDNELVAPRHKYSATCLAGNSVSQTYPKSLAKCIASPSTNDVNNVTFAAFLLPAGKFNPIFSNFSRNSRPPFLLFAL